MKQHILIITGLAATLFACEAKDLGNELPDAQVQSDASNCVPGRIIYINGVGGNYIPGADNDPVTNTSSIISQPATLLAYAGKLSTIVSCVAAGMADFNVTITTTDPGDVDHHEVVLTDSPASAFGIGAGVDGISPFTCMDHARMLNFAFTPGNDATTVCVRALWLIGTATNLSHVVDCNGPMTGQEYCGDNSPSFLDEDTACGQGDPQNCQCTGLATQNPYQHLLATFGAACTN